MDRVSMRMAFVAVVAVVAVACGGDSPSGPSAAAGGVLVQGVVLGEGAVTASSGVHASSAKPHITVRIEGTSISVNVSASGTFVLENVPAGPFTLVFESDGVVLGTIQVTAVAGATVKVVVQVQGTSIVLVEMKIEDEDETETPEPGDAAKTCAISGGTVGSGIELEGDVASGSAASFVMTVNGNRSSQPVLVNAGAASFVCNGNKKASVDCKGTVKAGAKVHVRGTLTACTLSTQPTVTASEVKVQKAAD